MIYAFLAHGFEEIEAIAPIDILKRCGIEVITVGIGNDMIVGAHGITVQTDITDHNVIISDKLEMVFLPGGMPGTLNLEKNEVVQEAIDFCSANNKYIAAICAAPSILGKKGLLKGKNATCFPGFEDFMQGAELGENKVYADGQIITGKGAGVAVEFSIKLVEVLCGKERAEKMKQSLQCNF